MFVSRFCAVIVSLMILTPLFTYAGDLDSPADPTDTGSAMYTLTDIYNRLDTGTVTAKRTGVFSEPADGPGTSTGRTLDEIMAIAPAKDAANGASVSDVLSGKTFWGLTGAGWGTGTGNIVTQTLSDTTTTVSAGYYGTTTLTAADADLAPDNIKSGVTIFGISGDSNVADTSSGDATAGDILSPKKAWVDGSEVTGSISTRTLSDGTTTVSAGYYGTTTLTAADADLATGNIKSGVTVFGVAGSTNVVDTTSGDAVAGDILSGKIAYVDGSEVAGSIVTQTLSSGTTTVSAGYYAATDLATVVDTDLLAANIISGKTIFGIEGAASAGVPKTGQTTSYSGTGGEDGDLQKGVSWPSPRFTNNGNGTVTDNLIGLIWLKDANAGGAKTWENALSYCNSLAHGTAGLTDGSVAGDWRLPNMRELQSLIDYGSYGPALPFGHPFTNVQSGSYWSSTTYSGFTTLAWYVRLDDDGHVYGSDKTNPNYVWPVRAGQ